MTQNEISITFTATDHALMFAWISRAVIQRVGEEEGEAVIRKGVRRYGEQRGNRMGLRAQAKGRALTMNSYMAYGEWRAGEDEQEHETAETTPQLKMHVTKCPWQKAWENNDLMPFGRLYCLEIDRALVHGFNPELRLDVNSTLTNDNLPCEFVFHGADPDTASDLSLDRERTVMAWDYHLGHLFKTLGEVVSEDLGPVGQEAMEEALGTFAQHYGKEAAAVIAGYQDTDFDRLPE